MEVRAVFVFICSLSLTSYFLTSSSGPLEQYGEKRGDVNTVGNGSRVDAIRSVYGPSVAKELIPVAVDEHESSDKVLRMEGFVSSANYSAKKTTMILFINGKQSLTSAAGASASRSCAVCDMEGLSNSTICFRSAGGVSSFEESH